MNDLRILRPVKWISCKEMARIYPPSSVRTDMLTHGLGIMRTNADGTCYRVDPADFYLCPGEAEGK